MCAWLLTARNLVCQPGSCLPNLARMRRASGPRIICFAVFHFLQTLPSRPPARNRDVTETCLMTSSPRVRPTRRSGSIIDQDEDDGTESRADAVSNPCSTGLFDKRQKFVVTQWWWRVTCREWHVTCRPWRWVSTRQGMVLCPTHS